MHSRAVTDKDRNTGCGSRHSYHRGLWRAWQSLHRTTTNNPSLRHIVGSVLEGSVQPPSHEHISNLLGVGSNLLITLLQEVSHIVMSQFAVLTYTPFLFSEEGAQWWRLFWLPCRRPPRRHDLSVKWQIAQIFKRNFV